MEVSLEDIMVADVCGLSRHLVIFSGRKYETLPSHINAVSPLYEDIVARMQDSASPLSKYALAVTDASHPATTPPKTEWDGNANRFDKPDRNAEEESYGAVVYPDRKQVPFPITQETVNARLLDGFLQGLPPQEVSDQVKKVDLASRRSPDIDVFVCVSSAIAEHVYKSPAELYFVVYRPTVQETAAAAMSAAHSMTL